jgi:hypothetical protein
MSGPYVADKMIGRSEEISLPELGVGGQELRSQSARKKGKKKRPAQDIAEATDESDDDRKHEMRTKKAAEGASPAKSRTGKGELQSIVEVLFVDLGDVASNVLCVLDAEPRGRTKTTPMVAQGSNPQLGVDEFTLFTPLQVQGEPSQNALFVYLMRVCLSLPSSIPFLCIILQKL